MFQHVIKEGNSYLNSLDLQVHSNFNLHINFLKGTALITLKEAALWTDARYFLQAEDELTKDWKLMKLGEVDCPRVLKLFNNRF